jgi:hypothetical protein
MALTGHTTRVGLRFFSKETGGPLVVEADQMVTGGKVNSRWLQAPATADTDLKSRVVKVQTTLVAGPGFGPIFGSARNGSVFDIGGFESPI